MTQTSNGTITSKKHSCFFSVFADYQQFSHFQLTLNIHAENLDIN